MTQRDGVRIRTGNSAEVRQLSAQHQVHHHADAVDVGAPVELLTHDPLGSHIVRCSEQTAALGEVAVRIGRRALAKHLRDAEIEHLDHLALTRRVQEDVVRLDVAVNDARGMRLGERRAKRHDDLCHSRESNPALSHEKAAERLAGEQLHHEVGDARRRDSEVEYRDSVRMREPARRDTLLAEALQRVRRLVSGSRPEDLDGDRPRKVELYAPEHRSESAGTDLRFEAVAAIYYRALKRL